MNISSHYKLVHFIPWTQTKIYKMMVLSIIPTSIYYFFNIKWLAIPWVPVALLGTATAFISGFKNTQTYGRTWEARQIYGAIINSSRSFGIMARDFIRINDTLKMAALQQELIYRHFAWLTALRFQLRETKSWENVKTKSYNKAFLKNYTVPEWEANLEQELKPFLSTAECQEIMATKNRATQIIATQSFKIKLLNEEGIISDYNYVALEAQLKDLYD